MCVMDRRRGTGIKDDNMRTTLKFREEDPIIDKIDAVGEWLRVQGTGGRSAALRYLIRKGLQAHNAERFDRLVEHANNTPAKDTRPAHVRG